MPTGIRPATVFAKASPRQAEALRVRDASTRSTFFSQVIPLLNVDEPSIDNHSVLYLFSIDGILLDIDIISCGSGFQPRYKRKTPAFDFVAGSHSHQR